MGPLLWNLIYHGVLRLKLPPGVKLVGFCSLFDPSRQETLRGRKLQLAHHKTEMIVANNRRSIFNKFSFKSHVDYARKCVSTVIAALFMIIEDISRICSSKRRLLASVAVLLLRNRNLILVSALSANCNARKLESTHKLMSLRAISAYRTISREVALVLAGLMPIKLVVKEDGKCYALRSMSNIKAVMVAE
ncbi:uncharacterized protein LOC134208825 [Armigeres subalbatus]|uniref:uncharacterized protein LOC134208825 n=1 Tax=Armigeres subalbatus TaxID=124917 RepID=UPI002ED4E33E